MVENMLVLLRTLRSNRTHTTIVNEQLRHAGYQDGERLPRTVSHWTNFKR
jgi:hypothetical protein